MVNTLVVVLDTAQIKKEDRSQQKVKVALRAASGKPQFEIGIGVHTGWVIFGSMGSARRQDYTVLGDAVATAYKLSGAAQPGQIVASEVTIAATQEAFHAEELPELNLSGRAASMRAYLVKEEAPKS